MQILRRGAELAQFPLKSSRHRLDLREVESDRIVFQGRTRHLADDGIVWFARATDLPWVTGFAGPNFVSASDRTKSDPEPRSSFGNQNPYAVQTMWKPSSTTKC